MKVKAFLDTNTFIYGFEFKTGNSARVLELVNEQKITAYVTLFVVNEIKNYFTRHYSKDVANQFVKYVLESCLLVFEEDFKMECRQLKGKIKEKDLGQIAATRALGLKFLISFDRDFKPFSEYRTPRQFLKEHGFKPKETEY